MNNKDQEKVLKEFEGKWEHEFYTGQFISCTKIKQFISNLLDEAEKEKHEAVQLGYDKAHKEIAKAYIEIEEKELNK